jgi:hypothetical protein
MKFIKSRLLFILLAAVLVLSGLATTPVLAAGPYPYSTSDAVVSDALDYLRSQLDTDGKIEDFSTSAWAVMAIAAAGENPHTWQDGSNPSIVDYLAANASTAASTTDYSRIILAIAAAGEDPTTFGSINFLSLLQDAYTGNQIGDTSLLNDDFWGVMALVAAGDPSSATIIQDSVNFILANQNATDGGWSWGIGQDSDVDDTAAAIMALIAAGEPASSTAITNGIAYIKNTQMANGGFESWGSTNSGTDSWGICGIAAAGEDPTSAGWKSTSDKDPVDDLLTFQNTDGSFDWTEATPSNMALMTSYAINALLGELWPVAILEPEPGVVVDVRIEGEEDTIWSGSIRVNDSTIFDDQGGSHYLAQPTALGALDEAATTGEFDYVVKDSSYGIYIQSVNGEEPEGLAGWMYRIDYYSPMVGAADFVLDQTTPPATPHSEVLFAYAEYGQLPLKIEVDETTIDVGGSFTATVSEFDDATETWTPIEGATVHANIDYTTGQEGTVDITIANNVTLEVYAEKEDYIRSNRITITVGTGSSQDNDNGEVDMTADIIPAISINVSPNNIDFGTLGPRDESTPVGILIENTGAWDLLITTEVSDDAEGLYEEGLNLDNDTWDVYSSTILRDSNTNCYTKLIVPETYALVGEQVGTIIFWAEEAP